MADAPNQIPKLDFSSLDAVFNQHYSQLIDRVNSLLGYSGPVKISNHLDMQGFKIQNLGEAAAESDALSSGVANKSYSAEALKPKISPGGPQSIPGYRQLGSGSQREPTSS